MKNTFGETIKNTFKEKIILANSLNMNEMLKSLARNNVNSFNLKIMGAIELSKYALMKSGKTVTEKYITRKESVAIITDLISEISYFENSNYHDASNAFDAICSIRKLIPENEAEILEEKLKKGEFKEKNKAIIKLYKNYIKYCKKNGLIDSIMIMRKAIEEAGPVDALFFQLDEFPITPIEEKMLSIVSGENESKTVSIRDIYELDEADIKIAEYRNNYGVANEAEDIISQIYMSNNNVDDNTIVVCDAASYSQVFYDIAILNDIPMTFGVGVPISNSYPGKLLNLYYLWKTEGYFGVAALKRMIFSDYFDRDMLFSRIGEKINLNYILEQCGRLRLCDDADKNKTLVDRVIGIRGENDPTVQYISIIGEILSLPLDEFIMQYSKVRFQKADKNGMTNSDQLVKKLDTAAVGIICDEIRAFKNNESIKLVDVIPQIIKMNICKEKSKAGFIHLSNVSGAYSALRKELYVAGLSATKFPGAPKENYIILDNDYKLFEAGEDYISTARIIKKKNALMNLIKLFSSVKANIHISYAGLNVSELKSENASSIIFELYRMENGEDASFEDMENAIKKIEYFAPGLSNTRMVGKTYTDGNIIALSDKISSKTNEQIQAEKAAIVEEMKGINTNKILNEEIVLSASMISTYAECTTKFIYKYLFNTKVDEVVSATDMISNKDEGILAHKIMESVANRTVTKEEFNNIAEEIFDNYLINNAAVILDDAENEKNKFMAMMDLAYNQRPTSDVINIEEEIRFKHEEFGLTLSGRPDCVMKLDGTDEYVVIDYKTSYEEHHFEDDIRSCIQGIVYAYLLEKRGIKVNHCEFRYLRTNSVIKCQYTEEIKEEFDFYLERIKNTIIKPNLNGYSNPANLEDCFKCEYRHLCGR